MAAAMERPFILPYEPEYTAHRTSRRGRRNARMLKHVHMNILHESPSIAPDLPASADDVAAPAVTDSRLPHRT